MAPELPGSHSSGPAEKEKTAKGGEGREAVEPERLSVPAPRLRVCGRSGLGNCGRRRAPAALPPAMLIGEPSGSALKGRGRALWTGVLGCSGS